MMYHRIVPAAGIGLLLLILFAGCSTTRVATMHPLVASETDTLFMREPSLLSLERDGRPQAGSLLEFLADSPRKLADFVTGGCSGAVLGRPTDVHVDQSGLAYICDGDLGRVLRVEVTRCAITGLRVLDPTELGTPTGVEPTPFGLIVSDSGRSKVFRMTAMGTVVGELAAPEAWIRPGQMNWDGERLFICDTGRHVVEVFGADGSHLVTMGGAGAKPGEFLHPVAVSRSSDGRIWVLDALNHRVQAFTPDLRPESSFGVYDHAPGGMMFPKGLALDEEDHIYISDAFVNRIQVFSTSGALLYWFGEPGRGDGQFLLPGAMHAQGNRIHIADQYNRRVQVYEYLPQRNAFAAGEQP